MLRSAAILGLLALSAQEPADPLDTPMPGEVRVQAVSGHSPCTLWFTLEQLRRQAQLRIGFEHTADCQSPGWTRWPSGAPLTLDGLTPREALTRILAERPDYTWTLAEEVVLVRPRAAWPPAASPLNLPVQPLALPASHPHHALHAIFQAVQPSIYLKHTDLQLSAHVAHIENPDALVSIDRPHPFRFEGGTLLQALNRLTRPFGGSWEASYTTVYNGRHLDVRLWTPDPDDGSVHIKSIPLAIAQP